MPLPKQVEEAGKRADERIKEINEKTAAMDPAAAPVNPVETPAEPAPAPEPATDQTDWKHKFEVLQGKYNKEIKDVRADVANLGQLRQDNARLTGQVVELTANVTELTSQIKELRGKNPDPHKTEPTPRLSDADREYLRQQDLDDRTIEILTKSIGYQPPPAPDPNIAKDIKTLKDSVAEVQQTAKQTDYNSFIDRVRGVISDFDAINNSAEFVSWLQEPVSQYTPDITRQYALNQAAAKLDHVKAADIFKAFISETNPAPETSTPTPKDNPLEKEIEPRSSAASDNPSTTPKGRTYTVKQVQQFYKDMATSAASNWSTGPWASKGKECLAMDADIKKASIEGRIIRS